jgi:predicted PurR-regulated permease PerM
VSRWEPPLWFDRLGGVAWRCVIVIVAGAIVVSGVVALSAVIVPVVLGLLFTCVLGPVAAGLRRRGVPTSMAAGLAVLLLTCASSAAVTEIVDLLFHGVIQLVPTIAGVITAVVLSLLVAFFFVKDGASMWRWIVARFDTRDGIVDRVGLRVWPVVTGYILGQTAIATIDASLIALGALALGVPEVGAILVITFFGAYIPYIGATIAGFVAVMLAVADGGIDQGVAMLVVVLVVQLLEGNVLQPWIQGRAVRLHPLVVALSVAAGGALAGFLGVFLAVPVTAAGVLALSELRAAGVLGSREAATEPT